MIIIQTKGVHDNRSGASGWGALIGDSAELVGARIIDELDGGHEAELYAMTGALVRAVKTGVVKRGDHVLFKAGEHHLVAIMLSTLGSQMRDHATIAPARRVSRRIEEAPALIDLTAMIKHYDLTIEMAVEVLPPGVTAKARESMRLRRAEIQ